MLFPIFLLIAAGFTWLFLGKTLAIGVAVIGSLIWGMRGVRALARKVQHNEVSGGHERSRLIARRGLPRGFPSFEGKARSHQAVPWCDGWCSDPDHVSTVVINRKKRHKKNLGIVKEP
jgi:hypothetical protein